MYQPRQPADKAHELGVGVAERGHERWRPRLQNKEAPAYGTAREHRGAASRQTTIVGERESLHATSGLGDYRECE
jgi:hypothetical protein